MNAKLLLLAALGLTLGSCTLSEPDQEASAPESLQLSSVRCFGFKMMDVDYDAQGRITQISATNEEKIELTYVGTSKVPSTIIISEYDLDYDDDDRATSLLSEQTTFTNIRANNAGCITYYDYAEKDLRNRQTATGHVTLNYNDKNQLVSEVDEAGDVTSYTWTDNCLTRIDEGDGEYINFEYSTVDNTSGQWDPMLSFKPMINITGLFGVAPKKFVKKSVDHDEAVMIAYNLLPNGMINHAKYVEVDSEESITSVLNFVYSKK